MRKTFSEVGEQIKLGYKVLRLVFESSPKWGGFYLGANAVSSIIPAVSLYIGKLAVDAVIAAIKAPTPEHIRLIILLALVALAAEGVNSLFASVSMYGYDRMKDIFNKFATQKLLEKAAELEMAYFDSPKFHDQLEKVQRELYRFIDAMSQVVELISSFFGLLSLLLILLRLAWWAPIVLAVFSLPRLVFRLRYSYYTYQITDRRSPYHRQIWQLTWLLTHKDAAAEIKTFNLKSYLLDKFVGINDKFIEENKDLSKKQNIYSFLLDVLGSSVYYGLALLAAFRAVTGFLTIGDLTMLTGTIRQFQINLQGIFAYLSRFYQGNLFLARYFEFTSLKATITDPPRPKIIDTTKPIRIEFKNVSFAYVPGKEVLKDVNFLISDARNFALVGENGAGKTTLVKLVLRLYDVTDGQILINDVDIREISLVDLRQNVGVIFQDFMRYSMTVRENIGFGDVRRINNIGKVRQAARLSGAAEFVERFPEKYQTVLGRHFDEEGEELSGGQWQKIALARAFFKDAPVLVLDEPTASLDPKSEYEVFRNLISHTAHKSLILISHRFSTVRLADEIIVLHKGEIVEQGSHEELMERNGHYAKLYNLQAKWYR